MKKISGQLITDHLASVANTSLPDKIKTVDDIQCSGVFNSTQAMLCYGNRDNMHRPYLYLTGHVTNLTGDFPCGINEIVLGDKNTVENPGPAVSFQLEFSQDELAQLCQKGLFTRQFKCPDIFVDNEFIMPLNCQCEYLEPEDEGDVPLLFIGIKNQHNIQMNAVDTGYSLADYFETVKELSDEKSDDMLDYSVEFQGQAYQSDDVYYRESDDFLFDNDYDKEQSVSSEQPIIKQPIVLSEADKILHSHFENVQKTVDDRLSRPLSQAEPKSDDDKPVQQNITDAKENSFVSDILSEANASVSSEFASIDDVNDNEISNKVEAKVEDEIEKEFEDEQDSKNNAVVVNQAENLEDELPNGKRDVPTRLSDIAEADDELYDDVYSDDDEEFI